MIPTHNTTLLNFFTLAYLTRETNVLVASMESKPERLMAKMLRTAVGGDFNTAQSEDFIKNYAKHLYFADVMGYIKQPQLLEMMKFCYQRHGIQQCFIDSLMRIDGLEEDYKAQGEFLNTLQEFAKTTDCHVHLVAHPRKSGDTVPGKLDIKGSSLIPNNADNIICVSRNMEKEKKRKDGTLSFEEDVRTHDAEIRIEKQRETGWEGRILLKFDPKNFKFSKFK